MDAVEFLEAVLPSTGTYCVCELSTDYKRHQFTETIGAAVTRAEHFAAAGFNTYYAMASFQPGTTRRLAENAQYMRSFVIDIDIDAEGKGGKYKTKRDAVAALHTFLHDSGLDALGQPWLVDSGGGVHVYWPLDDDVAVADWQPIAERLKRTAVKLGFHIDKSVTADTARVMRVPGTLNQKYDPPKPSSIKREGDTFNLDDFDSALPTLAELGALAPVNGRAPASDTLNLPGKPPTVRPLAVTTVVNNIPGTRPGAAPSSAVGKALVAHIDSSFNKIRERSLAGDGCAQIRWFHQHADEDGMEPMWRAMLSLAKCTTEGETAGKELAALHPYDDARLQAKWNALQGPYSCTKIEELNPGGCAGCPHAGKITNPLPLGYAYAPQVIPATPTTPTLPALPGGFAFSKGTTCRIVPAEGEDGADTLTPILPYIFYLHSVMQEADTYCARFCRIVDADTINYVALPMRSLAKPDDTLKELARQNVFSAGKGNDLHLFQYVRSCAQEASAANASKRVPPKYGWQPDGSFAFGETVVSATGDYTFVSDRLGNLIEGMRPAGSMAEWQRVMTMLCNKGCYDVITLALTGFASPLMRWSNNGADAAVLHACSRESGVGKSLALTLGRSVWGGKRLAVVPKTSENTMLQRAGLLGGLPLYVDEVTSKNRNSEMEWIPSFIFDYAQGQHKLKGSSSANAELSDNMTWSGLALITSNSPVLEHMLGARDTSSNGEVQRFLEYRTETRIDFTDEERDILQLLNDNYGLAGPIWADWLVRNVNTAKEVFSTVLVNLREQIQATDAERYWLACAAALIASAVLLGPKHANICRINAKRVMEFLIGLINNARRLIESNVTSAGDLISSFLREHHGMFIKVGRMGMLTNTFQNTGSTYTMPDSARGKIVGRVEYELTPGMVTIFLDVATLKKFCSTRNWSYVALKSDLMHEATVTEKLIDVFKGTSMSGGTSRCLQLVYAASSAPTKAP